MGGDVEIGARLVCSPVIVLIREHTHASVMFSRPVGEHVAEQEKALATSVTKIGQAVRGSGNAYAVTDSELAGSFKVIF